MRLFVITLLLTLVRASFGSSISEVDKLHEMSYPLLTTNPDSALYYGSKALIISKDIGYDWGIANSYYIQGYAYQKRNELSAALLMYLRASELLKYESDDRSVENYIGILTLCGTILRYHSKYDEAIKYYDDAINIASQKNLETDRLRLLYNKSLALRESERFIEGLEILKEAETLAINLADHERLLNCWVGMGNIYEKLKEHGTSKYYFRQVISSPNSDNALKGITWKNLGEVFELQNNFDSAEYCYLKGIDLIQSIEEGPNKNKRIFETLLSLSGLYLKQGEYQKGKDWCTKAENYYSKVDVVPDYYKLFKLLSDFNYKMGRENDAYGYMTRYYEENNKYQLRQEEVLRLKEKYKIDILLAGFHSDLERESSSSRYQMIIAFLLLGIILWIAISRFKSNHFKVQLEREIRRINKDSLV